MTNKIATFGLAGLLTLGACSNDTGLVVNPSLPAAKTITHIHTNDRRGSGILIDQEGDGLVDEFLINPNIHKPRDSVLNPNDFAAVKGTIYKVAPGVTPSLYGPHQVLSDTERSGLSIVAQSFYKK